jgi:hypothetical protein
MFMESQDVPAVVKILRPQILKLSKVSSDLPGDIIKLITDHFKDITWSLEKDEWSKMSASEKNKFAQTVITTYHLK